MKTLEKKYLPRFEQALIHYFEQAPFPSERLKQAIHYSLFPGGKRIRPLLVYGIGEILQLDEKVSDLLAIAIEMIHSYSLIHDDLPAMDDDDLRRGLPTCHRAFDEATAILAGDALQTLAFEALATYLPRYIQDGQVVQAIKLLAKASGSSGMVSGQMMDLFFLNQAVNFEILSKTHALKTGALFSACIEMPMALTSMSAEIISGLQVFSQTFGLVYQMQDDFLDRYSVVSHGKGRLSDVENGKFTFADLCSETELKLHIQTQFEQALDALKTLPNAQSLIELVETLAQRMPAG